MASTHDYIADKRNKDILIYINGEFFHRSEAKVSVFDSGFLLGDGVWEGIRLHKNSLIHFDQHINRLYAGADAIAMKIHLNKNELKDAVRLTIEKNEKHPKVTIGDPTIVIIPEYKKPNSEGFDIGIRLASVKTKRDNMVQDPKINSLSKMNCISACIEAERLGVDEGLMFDPNGFVSTCNSTNFFIVKKDEVWTSAGEFCLNGVTRGSVIKLCKSNHIRVFEKDFLIDDVYNADEAFVTGTFSGIIPVVEIDEHKFNIGSLTKRLSALYKEDIENS